MNLPDYFSKYSKLISQPGVTAALEGLAELMIRAKHAGGKVILAGNGASASISSHLATDFSKQAGIQAMAFNDANLITALGNDYGYEKWISKALELYGEKGDILILISSSGKSPNVVDAARTAKALGLSVVAFTGFDQFNPLGEIAEHHFWVDSRAYNIVECVHMIWLTGVCDLIIGDSEYTVSG